jgi:hypothetical protein
MEDLNKGIQFTRAFHPTQRSFLKEVEMLKADHQEALKRLEQFKANQSARIDLLSARGVPEIDIENYKFEQSNEYIQLLERAILCKKQVEWMDRGLRGLISDKIHLLESML